MNTFQKIEELAEDVKAGRIGLAEALLRAPVDFSDCEGEVTEMTEEQLNNISIEE